MSVKRREIYSSLRYKLIDLAERVGKCIIYQNSSNNLDHWKSEVFCLIHSLPIARETNEFPTYEELRRHVLYALDDHIDAIAYYLREIAKIEGLPQVKFNEYLLEEFILDYCNWLMGTLPLSKIGIVSHYLVFGKIDELISEYNRRK